MKRTQYLHGMLRDLMQPRPIHIDRDTREFALDEILLLMHAALAIKRRNQRCQLYIRTRERLEYGSFMTQPRQHRGLKRQDDDLLAIGCMRLPNRENYFSREDLVALHNKGLLRLHWQHPTLCEIGEESVQKVRASRAFKRQEAISRCHP